MAAVTSKRLIPVELLRRSTRIQKSNTIIFDHSSSAVDATNSHDTKKRSSFDDRRLAKKKRIKSEPKAELKSTSQQQLKQEKHIEQACDIVPEITKSLLLEDTKPYVVADGFLEVDEEELDLERTLLGGQSFRWSKEESITDNGPTLFTGVVGDDALQLWRCNSSQIAFRKLNKELLELDTRTRVISILEDYFQLKYKLKDLYREWSLKDRYLKECCMEYRGFRILRQDPRENVFSFICATNNNIKRISQMIDKLCKRFGNVLENRDKNKQSIYDCYQRFPTIERLAQDDVFECLRYELGFGYRAKFITETAKELVRLSNDDKDCSTSSPQEYLLKLRDLSYKETCKKLMQFPGIGRKVADCICLMSMDHLNAVPIDCHIYEIVCRNYMPKLRQERKTLNETVHDMIGNYFNNLHGPLAGWSTSVLFIGELKHLKKTDNANKKDRRNKIDLS